MRLQVHDEKPSTRVLSLQSKNQRQIARARADALVMDSKTRTIVARNVLRLRKAHGWNQTELAQKSGAAQTAISSIENEHGKSPTLSTLDKVATAFGVESWLLTVAELPSTDKETLNGIASVVGAYIRLPDTGKRQVERVAEAEDRYAKAL